MYKLSLTLIFISATLITNCQIIDKINNVLGIEKEPEILNREVVIYSEDSTIKAFIYIGEDKVKINNMLEYYWYYSSQIKSNIGGYSGELLNGEFLVYNQDKNLIQKGYFNKGLKNGEWKRWNKHGNLINIISWKNGVLHGVYNSFYINGKINTEANYFKGKLHGVYKEHKPDTIIIKNYKKGIEIIPE